MSCLRAWLFVNDLTRAVPINRSYGILCCDYIRFYWSSVMPIDVKFHDFWRELFQEIFREIYLKYFKKCFEKCFSDYGCKLYSSLQQSK